MDDLNAIVDAVEFFENRKKQSGDELAKWFQLIDLYTNFYPKDAMIVYLVKNNLNDNKNTIEFVKSLVRQAYSKGSTVYIKYDIYNLIVKIMHEKWEVFYDKGYVSPNFFGRLYQGFGLLGVYLNPEQLSVYPFNLTKIKNVVNFWDNKYYLFDAIGNIVPIDISEKDLKLGKTNSNFLDIKYILEHKSIWNSKLDEEMIEKLTERYERFFRGEE